MTSPESSPSETSCRVCRARGAQTFSYMDGLYLFDLERAAQLVQDGREPVELEPDDVRFSVRTYPLHKVHVGHVDPRRPGLLAHVWYTTEDGAHVQGHRLIDGHHRAARCLDEGVPFFAYLLSEEESRAILLRGPEEVRLPATADADPRAHNRRAWNDLVARKQRFTRPASDEDVALRQLTRWLAEGVAGKRMLLLGAGGGHLSMVRAAAGAIVTVVDLSDDMLALDQEQSAQRGLSVRTVQASMDDLGMLEPASFDIVEQPVSTCYVPDVRTVYRQVARVLVPGGLYLSHHKEPTSLQAGIRPTASGGYELTEPYYREGPLPPVVGSRHREPGTLEFLHRWEQLLGGLCRSGFVIEDLYEAKRGRADAAPGSFEHRCLYIAPYVSIRARRIA